MDGMTPESSQGARRDAAQAGRLGKSRIAACGLSGVTLRAGSV